MFNTSQAIKLSGTSFHSTDPFKRANLFDGLYTEKLINSALGFLSVVRNLFSKVRFDEPKRVK